MLAAETLAIVLEIKPAHHIGYLKGKAYICKQAMTYSGYQKRILSIPDTQRSFMLLVSGRIWERERQ